MSKVERLLSLLLENQIAMMDCISISFICSDRADDKEIAKLLHELSESSREFLKLYNDDSKNT